MKQITSCLLICVMLLGAIMFTSCDALEDALDNILNMETSKASDENDENADNALDNDETEKGNSTNQKPSERPTEQPEVSGDAAFEKNEIPDNGGYATDDFSQTDDPFADFDDTSSGTDIKETDRAYTEINPEKWYVRYPYKVRNRATSIDSEKYILGTVNYGEEVTVVGVDGKYYVIDFTDENGAKAKGYIYKDFLTKSKGMTELQKFVDADGKEITKEGTVKIDFNGLSLRTTPWYSKGLPDAFVNCNLIAGSNETWKIPNGSKVTVIGKTAEVDKNSEVNGYWVKIEATAAPVKDGDSEVKLTGWCPEEFIEFEQNTTDSTSNPTVGEENIPAV